MTSTKNNGARSPPEERNKKTSVWVGEGLGEEDKKKKSTKTEKWCNGNAEG
jgi:hypothetical protein